MPPQFDAVAAPGSSEPSVSSARSGMWTTGSPLNHAPIAALSATGLKLAATNLGECLRHAARMRDRTETLAVMKVHRRADRRRRTGACAFSSIASNTGARSPGEELMTRNTSAVAVCCSKRLARLGDEPRVLHRDDRLRGEVLQQRDLLVGERPDLLAVDGR